MSKMTLDEMQLATSKKVHDTFSILNKETIKAAEELTYLNDEEKFLFIQRVVNRYFVHYHKIAFEVSVKCAEDGDL